MASRKMASRKKAKANANVIIGWTSDLVGYNSSLVAAIEECARVMPGCHYIVVGNNVIINDANSADIILAQTSKSSRFGDWAFDPLDTIQQLNYVLNYRNLNTDYIILLTKDKMIPRQIGDNYEYHDERTAVISLNPCESLDEVQQFATILLKHVMGHFYIGEGPEAHCVYDYCTMTDMEHYRRIMELANCEADFGFDSFCDDCKERLRASKLWSKKHPSTIECL